MPGSRIPPAISLPRGENVVLTDDVLAEMLRVIRRDAEAGNWQSERLAAAARMLKSAVDRQQAAGSPNAWPAGLEHRLGGSGADVQAGSSSEQKVINLDQAAGLLGVTSRERARQLVARHGLHHWRNPDGRHEMLVFRAEVIAVAEERSGIHGTGSGPEGQGTVPGGGPGGGGGAAAA